MRVTLPFDPEAIAADAIASESRNVVPMKPKAAKKKAEGWEGEWHTSDSGSPLPTLFNVMLSLRNHPQLSRLVRFDEMARSVIIIDQIPGTPHDRSIPRPVKDADVIAIQEELQQSGLRRIAKATVQDGVQLRAEQDRFHPVHDYLHSLKWDGIQRVDKWLSFYLGAEPAIGLSDEERARKLKYISKIGRLFLIAMVARMLRPGCKADYMLILEGPQGAMKSSACAILAGEWFSDNLPDLSRGDAVRLSMHLRGKWLIEIAEMSSFNSAEAHTLKEFLTQTEERYTPKFGRNEVCEPRQCLFIGSTNEGSYLRDATGARRFWPVRVGAIDIDGLKADRDQLIAEAVQLFHAGEKWWPERQFEADVIAPEQKERFEEDPWQDTIELWLSREGKRRCTVNEVLRDALNLLTGQFGTREQRRVSAIFRHMEWSKSYSEGKSYFWKPKGGDNA